MGPTTVDLIEAIDAWFGEDQELDPGFWGDAVITSPTVEGDSLIIQLEGRHFIIEAREIGPDELAKKIR